MHMLCLNVMNAVNGSDEEVLNLLKQNREDPEIVEFLLYESVMGGAASMSRIAGLIKKAGLKVTPESTGIAQDKVGAQGGMDEANLILKWGGDKTQIVNRAAMNGNIPIVRGLGESLSEKDKTLAWTKALSHGEFETAEILLNMGANPKKERDSCIMAVMDARDEWREAASIIMKNGVEVAGFGDEALISCFSFHSEQKLRWLVENGVKPTEKFNIGLAMHGIVRFNDLALLDILLETGIPLPDMETMRKVIDASARLTLREGREALTNLIPYVEGLREKALFEEIGQGASPKKRTL